MTSIGMCCWTSCKTVLPCSTTTCHIVPLLLHWFTRAELFFLCYPPSTTGFMVFHVQISPHKAGRPRPSARYVPADASQQCGGAWSTPALVARSDTSCGATRLVWWRGIVPWNCHCQQFCGLYLRGTPQKSAKNPCHINLTCIKLRDEILKTKKASPLMFYDSVSLMYKYQLCSTFAMISNRSNPCCIWGSVYMLESRSAKPLRQQQLPVNVSTLWPCSPESLSWRPQPVSRDMKTLVVGSSSEEILTPENEQLVWFT